MKKHLLHISLLFLSLLVLASCTERMSIDLPTANQKLVVEGYLFPGDSSSWIRLTTTSAYFANQPPHAVLNASLGLDDGHESWVFHPLAQKPGYYFINANEFTALPGKIYHLNIQLSSPIGNETHFESQTTMPPLRIHIDSIGIQYAPDIKNWVIRLYARDSVGKDFYLFNSRVNDRLITDSIPRKSVRSDEFFDGRYLHGLIVQVLNKDELHPGDLYQLDASNITEAYYNYIQGLQLEIGNKNPLFSGPPANAQGNISGGALGFFTAFATTSFRVKLQASKSINKYN